MPYDLDMFQIRLFTCIERIDSAAKICLRL
jgi:hypothetical protein